MLEQKTRKFPVLVFIHGDSFEWSSGNPYDGRMLTSYGNVMVITVNFRLGILGFMKPSLTEHVYGNNGLLDQLAALQWIKDNIEDMNGDPTSVTLMGHGTGAACINFLMLSPISNGLFHRAILMSGSALSDWAMTKDPTPYTLQVAQSLGCSPNSKNMMSCLQRKPLSEIKKVQILAREFETPLGPVVAGSFIPNEPAKTMQSYPNLLSKYQLLSGVTELDRYHDFGVIELEHGVLENQRDDFIKKYAKIIFEGAENEVLKTVLKEYSPSKLDPQRWNVETNRDVILNMFSDARSLSPVVRFADYQSKANSQSYFYVFGHNSVSSDYAALNKSVQGEELPYVFGVPLGLTNTHFSVDYTQQEKLLSEVVMKMWSNFVKNGSPNIQSPVKFFNLDKRQWSLYNLYWPEYDSKHQTYLRFDIPPGQEAAYRSNFTKFWGDILPKKMSEFIVDPLFEYTRKVQSTQRPKQVVAKSVHRSTYNPSDDTHRISAPRVAETSHYSSSTYGRLRPYSQPIHRPDTNFIYKEIMSIDKPHSMPSGLSETPTVQSTTVKPKLNMPVKTSSATITLIVSLGILFLAVNFGICSILYFKKRKLRLREQTLDISRQPRAEIGEVDVIGQKSSKDDKSALRTLKNSCSVIKSMSFNKSKSNSKKQKKKSEVCKTPKSDDSGGFRERFQLRRHLSTSTLDAHTKVRDWIANEVMHRCSPGILRQSNSDLNEKSITVAKPFTRSEELLSDSKRKKDELKMNDSVNSKSLTSKSHSKTKTSEKTTSTSALGSHSSISSTTKRSLNDIKKNSKSIDSIKSKDTESLKSKKVSVAIDATPAARTNSILNQDPIKIVKSCDSSDQIHSNSNIVNKFNGNDSKTVIKNNKEEETFTNIITLSVTQKPLIISHKHSSSDPVTDINYEKLIEKMEYGNIANILPPVTFRNDINVTSREENSSNPMTAEQALQHMKNRNFPKVLPDLPKAQKRLSLQPNSLQTFRGYSMESQTDRPRVPPQPPPRTTTLERRLAYTSTKPLSSFDVSQVKKINEDVVPKDYENIDNLSSYHNIQQNVLHNKNKFIHTDSTITMPKERVPRVIIASSDIPSIQDPKIVITPSPSQIEIPINGPRVRLPDDFHSRQGSLTSFSSFYSDDDDDEDDNDETFEDFENELIKELVGGVDSPTNMLDSKGPETIFEKKLEIVPVKINHGNIPSKMKDERDFVCFSNLLLPDVSDLEKTAQIKPNLSLNKLQHRTESINKPPEKAVKVKQRKSMRTPSILNRHAKSKRGSDRSNNDSIKLEHSTSGSSNDTETSTGTVKRVELKKE
ncbi:unnamed protein product [Arctia plantaginis]|uniref:Carboxylesterase type B domain-containing protein n=1 Tax=Arctia plantaginis TaxID=874455 RepID=A0A8S0Z579_ARCPL|nr:unnamed protein product [Arctia plantaginis]